MDAEWFESYTRRLVGYESQQDARIQVKLFSFITLNVTLCRGRIYAGVDEMKENLEAVSQNTAKTSLEAFSVFINKALEGESHFNIPLFNSSWSYVMDLEFEGGFKKGKKSSFWRSSAVKKKQQEPEATPQTPTLDAQAKDKKKSLL